MHKQWKCYQIKNIILKKNNSAIVLKGTLIFIVYLNKLIVKYYKPFEMRLKKKV